MPKEYIEREAVEKMLEDAQVISDGEYTGYCIEDVSISSIPAANVVEVVRCGECIHHSKAITPGRVICDKHAIPRNDTDFCSDGRRDKPEN